MTTAQLEVRQEVQTIAVVSVVHGISHFYQLVLPSLYPWLMRDFNLGYTEVGSAMTLFFVVSGLCQAVAGVAVDKLGAQRVLMGAVALLGLSTLVLSLANGYPMLLLAGALAGLGNAAFHPADFALLNHRVSTPRLGYAFSAHGVSGSIGWALAPVTMTLLAAGGHWHVAALGASCVAVVGLLLLWWCGADVTLDKDHAKAESGAPASSTLDFLKLRAVWLCFLFFTLTAMALGALQGYLPTAAGEVFGLPVAGAALALSAYLLGNAGGTLAGGFVSVGNLGRDGWVAAMLGFGALVAALLATGLPPAWSVAPLLGLVGFASGMAGPSRDLLVRQAATARFGKAAYGRIYGFVYSGLDTGMALAPLVFGPFMDAGVFVALLAGVALLNGLSVLTALGIGRELPASQGA
ncbi:MAG: MFS transporter [Rhodocyclaceae bacterium]|nr:MAG: MFS transporter [Rhodocyclaceae bacterium]